MCNAGEKTRAKKFLLQLENPLLYPAELRAQLGDGQYVAEPRRKSSGKSLAVFAKAYACEGSVETIEALLPRLTRRPES